MIILARAPKSRTVDHALMLMYEGPREPLEIPDWALDKHTRRGAKMGRGHDHFLDVGALLEGETIPDPYAAEGRAAPTHERDYRATATMPLCVSACGDGSDRVTLSSGCRSWCR